jgi:hypothetical protein
MEIPDLSRKCLSGQIPRSISRVKHHIQIHIQVTRNYFKIPNPEPNPEPSPRSYPCCGEENLSNKIAVRY